jgi:hypothetical protein
MGSADRSTRKDSHDKDTQKKEKDALDARRAQLKELHEATQRHKPTKK